MEYRAQIVLGLLQIVIVVIGWQFVGAHMGALDENFDLSSLNNSLMWVRLIAGFGWLLFLVPLVWIYLSIHGQMSDSFWSGRRSTVISGLVILGALFGIFFSACQEMFNARLILSKMAFFVGDVSESILWLLGSV